MRILISSGEVSGDRIGGLLAQRIRRFDPSCILFGLGGKHMASAGVEVAFDNTQVGVVGLFEIISSIPQAIEAFLRIHRLVNRQRPDIAVLISCEGFNAPLAWYLKRRGIRTISYFPPQVWMWRRFVKLAPKFFDIVLTSFPEEHEWYSKTKCKVLFTGHYLLDILKPVTEEERVKARTDLRIPLRAPVVALLPGSRHQEVVRLGPLLMRTAAEVKARVPQAQFLLPVAQAELGRILADQAVVSELGKALSLVDDSHKAMQAADVGLIASGTATLEATVMGMPHVVFYRVASITAFLFRMLRAFRVLTDDMIGLPNLLATRPIVPEVLQKQATPAELARETLSILTDRSRSIRIKHELRAVSHTLGKGNCLDRVALTILDQLGSNTVRRSAIDEPFDRVQSA